MSNRIVLMGNAHDALILKNELLASGLSVDHDFTWCYVPLKYDGFAIDEPSHVVFEFQDPAVASFFRLKWTK